MRTALVLVDGEHHPPVLRRALGQLVDARTRPLAVIVVGGGEKVAVPGVAPELGVPAWWPDRPEHELPRFIEENHPDVVVDLSGEPTVDARRRLGFAAVCLASGVAYEAPGVRYDPPLRPRLTDRPTIAVVATGKRTGKTAMSAALTRRAAERGLGPIVVAMGRGGPVDPVIVTDRPGLDDLLAVADAGGHAASDFYEDAVTTGVPTVGCHRVGDGPAGAVALSNVAAGVAAADDLGADLIVLEGSGAALPPCCADATALIVPAHLRPDDLAAVLPLPFVLADVILVTLADTVEPPRVDALVAELQGTVARLRPRGVPVRTTALRPHPLGDVAGRRVLLATTAPPSAGPALAGELERAHRAEVVAVTHHLADRPRLAADLEQAPEHDVLVTELKAAGVDVAARHARDRGRSVVFLDHRPVLLDGGAEGMASCFDELITAVMRSAQATG